MLLISVSIKLREDQFVGEVNNKLKNSSDKRVGNAIERKSRVLGDVLSLATVNNAYILRRNRMLSTPKSVKYNIFLQIENELTIPTLKIVYVKLSKRRIDGQAKRNPPTNDASNIKIDLAIAEKLAM